MNNKQLITIISLLALTGGIPNMLPTSALAQNSGDRLGKLNCTADEIARFNGIKWVCSTDIDTDTDTLSDLQCSADQIARFDGFQWICDDESTSTGTATEPDPPCFRDDIDSEGNDNRYFDCGNGTVTDTFTGLIWLKDANCLELQGGEADWASANEAATMLADGVCGLSDGSVQGNWRLPTRAEWQTTINRAASLGCTLGGANNPPSLTDREGTGCFFGDAEQVFLEVQNSIYWSSTTSSTNPSTAGIVNLFTGLLGDQLKNSIRYIWPVRD